MDSRHQPLITPSASPPLSRSVRVRKRRKIAPSSLSSASTDFDLHSARRDSQLRVLDVWNQLADRYSRRLDEDDIVDIRTASLVKDRGVIRSSSTTYDFGFLTDTHSDGLTLEEDLDELDALSEGVLLDQNSTPKVPPLQPMDLADAEDLRLFLEAEKRRKAECGEDDCGDEVDGDQDRDDYGPEHDDGEVEEEEQQEGVVSDDDGDLSNPVADPRIGDDHSLSSNDDRRNDLALADSESEDELGKWESDEGNKVYKIEPNEPESDSDIEIIQVEISSKPPAPPSDAPEPILKSLLNLPPLVPTPTAIQLHTPPQSSSSVLEPTPDDRVSEIPSVSNPTLTNSRPRPRPITRKNLEEERFIGPAPSQSPAGLTLTEALNFAAKESSWSKPKPKPKLEVVVPRLASLKPKRGPIKTAPRTPSPPPVDTQPTLVPPNEPDSEVEIVDETPRLTAQQKGKAKAVGPTTPISEVERIPSTSSESDDPLRIIPSPSPQPASPVTTPRENASLSLSPFWTPSRKPRSAGILSGRGKKRKRVDSSPEGSVVATEDRHVVQPDDHEEFQPADVEALPSSPTASIRAVKDSKAKHRQHHSRRPKSTTVSATEQIPEPANADIAFPELPAPSEPYTPRRDRSSSRRRHSARNSFPPSPPAPPVAAPVYNPFMDPRAQYIISQAMHQLSCLMSDVAPPPGLQAWMPPPPPTLPPAASLPTAYQLEGGPPFLQYQDGQWVPYTPRHRGRKPHRRYPMSSPGTHSVSPSRSRSRSNSPEFDSYDPTFSGGTLPPSSPDPIPSSSLPSSPQKIRPKSLVRRSKSRGRRVSFRLGDEVARVDVAEEACEPGPSRSASASRVGQNPDRGGSKGKERAKARVPEDGNGDEDGEEWGYGAAEPVRGRKFVRGQTPGPPSRGPSMRPVTPPRNCSSRTPSRG